MHSWPQILVEKFSGQMDAEERDAIIQESASLMSATDAQQQGENDQNPTESDQNSDDNTAVSGGLGNRNESLLDEGEGDVMDMHTMSQVCTQSLCVCVCVCVSA